jgi:sister-chromatid-cohesion protein PDS5
MGFYCLAGYEPDQKQRTLEKSYMVADVEKRREYIKTLMMTASERASEQLPHIMPDYMLVFSVPVLTHSPRFTSHTKKKELVC